MLEKHAFIRYLVSQHAFKKRHIIWVLNFLAHHDQYLDDIHFVEDVTGCPRRLILSTHEMNTPPLLFCDEEGEFTIAEKIIEKIQQHRGEALYVQVNFPNWKGNVRYLKVLEDNPYIEGLLHQDELSRCADEVIEQVQKEILKKQLVEAIDSALDSKDHELFKELTKRLSEL